MGFKCIVLSALLLTSASVYADSIGWGSRPNHPGNQPGRPNQPSRPEIPATPTYPSIPSQSGSFDPWGNQQVSTVEENIQNYFNGQSRIDLLSDQYVRTQLLGLRIKDITIVASTEQGQGLAALVINGQSIENSKTVSRQMGQYTFKVDPFSNTTGQSLRTLELSMQGRFYVEKVIFNLFETSSTNGPGPTRPSSGPQVEIVRHLLNERIQQEGGLELFRMFNLGQERLGQTIKRVTVLARSDRGYGLASLMINDQQSTSSQNVTGSSTRLTFELFQNMRIGSDIQGLRLYFRGNISVEEVSIEFEKRNDNQFPPTNERQFEQIINQRLYDTSGVSLKSLMQIPSQFDDRLVDSITLVLRQSEMGVRMKLCQQVQDQYQSVNCAAAVTISAGPQIVRLSATSFSKLRELSLASRMGMIDLDRIIINFK